MKNPIAIAILAFVTSFLGGTYATSIVPTTNEALDRTPTPIVQADKTGNFRFEKSQGAHTAVVIFHTRAFQRSKHRVTRDSRQQTRVDGRPAIGTDGNIP